MIIMIIMDSRVCFCARSIPIVSLRNGKFQRWRYLEHRMLDVTKYEALEAFEVLLKQRKLLEEYRIALQYQR